MKVFCENSSSSLTDHHVTKRFPRFPKESLIPSTSNSVSNVIRSTPKSVSNVIPSTPKSVSNVNPSTPKSVSNVIPSIPKRVINSFNLYHNACNVFNTEFWSRNVGVSDVFVTRETKLTIIYRSMMSIDITATKKTLPFLLSRRRVASPLLRSRRHFTASPTSRGPRRPYGLADVYVLASLSWPAVLTICRCLRARRPYAASHFHK